MTQERFVVVDIGCLECEAPSELLDITTMQGVERLGATHVAEVGDHGWGGDGMKVAFPIPEALALVLESVNATTMIWNRVLERPAATRRSDIAEIVEAVRDLWASYAAMLYAEQVDDGERRCDECGDSFNVDANEGDDSTCNSCQTRLAGR